MAQVVDSTNIEQFITTGKVDNFKAPADEVPAEVAKEPIKEPVNDDAAQAEDDEEKDLPERVRQQIGKKHRAMKEAEEFAEREYNQRRAAERRADALELQIADFQQKSRPAVVEVKEPQQSDFATVQEYVDALVNFKADQRIAKDKQEAEQQRTADEAERIKTAFANRITEFMKATPDFEAVTSRADVDLPAHVTQYILESDFGPQLGYQLSKDSAELNRILKLSPIRAIAELGKLEASLAKPVQKTEAKQEISKAPAPITPIDGKSAPVNPDLNRNMSFADYKALKQQQESAKRR